MPVLHILLVVGTSGIPSVNFLDWRKIHSHSAFYSFLLINGIAKYMPSAFILHHLFLLRKSCAGLLVKSTFGTKIRGCPLLCLSPLRQVTVLADGRGLEAFCMYLQSQALVMGGWGGEGGHVSNFLRCLCSSRN